MKRSVTASSKYDGKDMKPYKGYKIEKNWKLDEKGKPVPGSVRFMVIDEEDDWIGDVYKTLKEAHEYIDELTQQDIEAAKKIKSKKFESFSKWYNRLKASQRDTVDDIADEEGIGAYEEASDDQLQWLMDEADIVLKEKVDEDATKGEMPKELADRPYIFHIYGVNPTYSDDILAIAEDNGALSVRYDKANEDGIFYSNRFGGYAVDSKDTAKQIFQEVKKSRIPLNQRTISVNKVDWNDAWNIVIDRYAHGNEKISWHNAGKSMRVPVRSSSEPSASEYGRAISEGNNKLNNRYYPFVVKQTSIDRWSINKVSYRITLPAISDEWIAWYDDVDRYIKDKFRLYGPYAVGEVKDSSVLRDNQLYTDKRFSSIDQIMTFLFNTVDEDFLED